MLIGYAGGGVQHLRQQAGAQSCRDERAEGAQGAPIWSRTFASRAWR
jgi:hypothetical protein